jgi:hypothetical protein
LKSSIRFLKLQLLIVLGAFSLAGCSVDMFSGSKPDSNITGRERYRTVRPECAGLRFEKPELDPASFRSLVECFGSNGSLPELSKLVSESSDLTLSRTSHLVNETFLADGTIRDESKAIIRGLRRSGRWESILKGFAPALSETSRIRAVVRLLAFGKRDPFIIETMRRIEPDAATEAFELAARLVKSPAFAALSKKIEAEPLTVSERSRLIELLGEFFRTKTPRESGHLLLQAMVAGKSAPLWNFSFGEANGVLDSVSRFRLLLRDFSRGDTLKHISRVQNGIQKPVSCWGDGKVFLEPWKNLSRELDIHARKGEDEILAFATRFTSVTALGIQDICAVPPEFPAHYPHLLSITAGRTGGEYLGLLHRVGIGNFSYEAGYFLGEWGEPLGEVLKILEARPWFNDLVLLFAELDQGDRNTLSSWMNTFLRDRAKWTEATSKWKNEDISAVFSDLGQWFGTDSAALGQMLDSIHELIGSSKTHPWFEGWKEIAATSETNGVEALANLEAFTDVAFAIGRMAEDGRLAAILGDGIEFLAGRGNAGAPSDVVVPLGIHRKTPRHSLVGEDLREIESWAPLNPSLKACASLDLGKSTENQWEKYQACLAGGGISESALSGIQTGQVWKMPGEEKPILDSFLTSWLSLPLNKAEKESLISIFTDAFSSSTLDFSSFASFKETKIFSVLNRFQTDLGITISVWQKFFSRIEAMLLDPRFAPLMDALRDLDFNDGKDAGSFMLPALPDLPATETSSWVHDLECISGGEAVSERVSNIQNEFQNGVLGWERTRGSLPVSWKKEELQSRLRSLTGTLNSAPLRSGLYQWIRGLNPREAAEWFTTRARDPRLVAVMDVDSKELKVRWMTSLDRLESILVNSDFTYLLGENYGLKFIGKFAEAWGDEPRSAWPREIQARYNGRKRPPTLAEVYAEVSRFLENFEKLGGIAPVPECVSRDGAVARQALGRKNRSAPDFLIPFSVKAKAFNLRQTLSVIAENLPESKSPSAGGMRVLRDLFWSVYSSAPARYRSPSNPEHNPLRFFSKFGALGGLRSLSRGLQIFEFESEVLTLENALVSIQNIVKEGATDRLLVKLISAPGALEESVERAILSPKFRFGGFVGSLINGLGADRDLKAAAPFLRFSDSVLDGNHSRFPSAVFADLVLLVGERNAPRLSPWRISNLSSKERLKDLDSFLSERIFPAIGSLPIHDALLLLNDDLTLRKQVFAEAAQWLEKASRQSDGDGNSIRSPSPFLDLLLSQERPAFRRFVGLWCGRSAARYTTEIASHPDEALLIIGGLASATDSLVSRDFFESLLRELRD